MTRNGVKRANWGLLALALLALGLAGCGGDEPAPVVQPPAPPPAPPPFQPEPVEVALGESGSKVTLMTAEGGGYTLNGEAFEGGTVAAENGNEYTLALADGTWTATYIPVEVPVTLGTSGATLTMLRAEDGSFTIGGGEGVVSIATAPDGSPQGALAENGNQYALALADGEWTATYIMPPAVSVALGMSGDSVMVSKMEDGSYAIGDMAIMEGSEVMADNGNGYSLSMASGAWMATYMPTHENVMLGITGETAMLQKEEDGSYTLDGMAVMSGSTTMSSNGNMYTLSMDDAGMWSAAYTAPDPVTVALGTSGASITLVRNEDQSYSMISQSMVSQLAANADGSYDVTAANGNGYKVSMDAEGMWSAMYVEPGATTLALGTSGSNVNIDKNEDGTYSIGDQTIADGSVVQAGNGNEYRLTMVGGMWTAEYVKVHTAVTLGSSGESATLTRSEDGSYWLGETAVQDGSTTMASNGNTYALSMDADGNWMATFVAPDPMTVSLGMSGNSVSITMTEDGTYWIGDAQVMSGDTYEVGGNKYALSMDDAGMWSAMYMGEESMVALGTSGTTITLVRQEDGSYAMDGLAFTSGMTVDADNGDQYTVSMDADGMWSAMYVPATQTVTLGMAGDVTFTRSEDGTWSHDGTAVMSGDTVTANGNDYRLSQDSEGNFTATYQPATMEILGTGLTASAKEDGTGYNVDGASLGTSGTGNITVDGAMYRVWMDGTTLTGARYDKQRHDDSDTALRIDNPILRGDDEDTIGNENLTALTLNGENFPISDLLGSGTSELRGDNFVAAALKEVKKLKAQVEAYIVLDNADGEYDATYEPSMRNLWNGTDTISGAQGEVDNLFGINTTPDPDEPNVNLETAGNNDDKDDILALFDSLITALSTKSAFESATADDGGGVLEEAALSAADAGTAFDAINKMSMAMFGSTANTRYGAYWQKEQDQAHGSGDLGKLRYVDDGETQTNDRGAIGSFSYGVIDDVTKTLHLGSKGSLYYEGGTIAVTGGSDPKFYEGDIVVQVRLSTNKVNGVVSNLLDSDGLPWTHDFGTVESITLPEATLTGNADWNKQFADASVTATTNANYGNATINYKVGPGSPSPTETDGGFRGFLLGKSGDALGTAANGTWWIAADGDGAANGTGTKNLLTAGFGAEQTDAPPDYRPPESPITVAETTALPTGTDVTWSVAITDGELVLADTATDANALDLKLAITAFNEDAEKTIDGLLHVAEALKVVEAQRKVIEGWIGLDSTDDGDANNDQTLNGRDIAWDTIRETVIDLIFGQVADRDGNDSVEDADGYLFMSTTRTQDSGDPADDNSYPTTRARTEQRNQQVGTPDDAEALQFIDDIIAALKSKDKFADELKSGGIFNDTLGAFTATSAGDIFNREQSRTKVWFAKTDYTRFGAWRLQTTLDAAHGQNNKNGNTGENGGGGTAHGPASFAYSPLAQTVISSVDDPAYPSGGTFRYDGKTVAVQRTTFYQGAAQLQVTWAATITGTDVVLTLSDLVDANGVPLSATDGTVHELILRADVTATSDNKLGFTATDNTTTDITYTNRSLGNTTTSHTLVGKFLGKTSDGPRAAIGNYVIAPGQGLGNSTADDAFSIRGAFGVELP